MFIFLKNIEINSITSLLSALFLDILAPKKDINVMIQKEKRLMYLVMYNSLNPFHIILVKMIAL